MVLMVLSSVLSKSGYLSPILRRAKVTPARPLAQDLACCPLPPRPSPQPRAQTPHTFLAVDLLIAAVLLGQPGCVSVTVHQQDGPLALRAPGPGCLRWRGERSALFPLLLQGSPASVQTPQGTGEATRARLRSSHGAAVTWRTRVLRLMPGEGPG